MDKKEKMKIKIAENISYEYLNIVDESFMHYGPKGAQTHFRIEIASHEFNGMPLLKRHQKIQEILKEEFAQIKAFSLHTKTLEEWEKNKFEPSPTCHGSKA